MHKIKLGGWQRLWVLVSIVYAVVVGFFAWIEFPSDQVLLYEYAEEAFYLDYRYLTEKPDFKFSDLAEYFKKQGIPLDQYIERALIGCNCPEKSDSLKFKIEAQKLSEKFEKKFEELFRKRLKWLALSLAWWIVPCLLFYGFGMLAGWVYRGFRS